MSATNTPTGTLRSGGNKRNSTSTLLTSTGDKSIRTLRLRRSSVLTDETFPVGSLPAPYSVQGFCGRHRLRVGEVYEFLAFVGHEHEVHLGTPRETGLTPERLEEKISIAKHDLNIWIGLGLPTSVE